MPKQLVNILWLGLRLWALDLERFHCKIKIARIKALIWTTDRLYNLLPSPKGKGAK